MHSLSLTNLKSKLTEKIIITIYTLPLVPSLTKDIRTVWQLHGNYKKNSSRALDQVVSNKNNTNGNKNKKNNNNSSSNRSNNNTTRVTLSRLTLSVRRAHFGALSCTLSLSHLASTDAK